MGRELQVLLQHQCRKMYSLQRHVQELGYQLGQLQQEWRYNTQMVAAGVVGLVEVDIWLGRYMAGGAEWEPHFCLHCYLRTTPATRW